MIRLVVPYPAGGSVDVLARHLQQPLQEQLGATVVVDNRPGAGGRIAASQVRRDAADGSVILIAPNALTTIASLVYAKTLDYRMDDFQPVARIASYPFALSVPAQSSIRNAADFREYARANPGVASYGTSGAGGMSHFAGVALGETLGTPLTHVAYRGGAPLLNDLLGAHVPSAIDTLGDHIEQHRAGGIRIIGLFRDERDPLTPDIPTLAEQGIAAPPVEGWFGAFVPAGTPPATVQKLEAAFEQVLADPALQTKLAVKAMSASYLPSADFAALQADELRTWAPVVEASGFRPE